MVEPFSQKFDKLSNKLLFHWKLLYIKHDKVFGTGAKHYKFQVLRLAVIPFMCGNVTCFKRDCIRPIHLLKSSFKNRMVKILQFVYLLG